jgi:hypothetical protein
LLDWVSRCGTPGFMPTAEQLKTADPRRNDLVIAIARHDGFLKVSERLGLKMTHDTKPDGYYNDMANVAREVYAFVDEQQLENRMPTPGQLRDAGQTTLINAICSHGGFFPIANDLGLIPNRKKRGYWTQETVDLEIMEFLKAAQIVGMMPTDYELRAAERADLSVAISRQGGGVNAVAQRLGLATKAAKPDWYWNERTIASELLDFIRDHGIPGRMPTQAALCGSGRNDLAIAIARTGGGWTTVAESLNLKLTQMPKNHWNNMENVRSAILALNHRRGRPGEMPTKTDLDLAGEFSLGGAVEGLGGYPAVAAMFGPAAGRMSLWPRSREELLLAHEVMAFVELDLDDHKIRAGERTRAVDIVIHPLNLIVEYDSYRWHKDNIPKDAAKTQALLEAGWNVLRVREEPLGRILPSDVLVRKCQYKEICNRVLLAIQDMRGVRLEGVDDYLSQKEFRNITACELYIADYLRTRRGKVVEDP